MKRPAAIRVAGVFLVLLMPVALYVALHSRPLRTTTTILLHTLLSSRQAKLAVAVFLLWFVGLATVQLVLIGETLTHSKWPPLLFWKRWDLLNLCPMLTFFSRLPEAHYRLMIRDRYAGAKSEFTPWRLVLLPAPGPFRSLWNPERRVCFAIEDACRSLLRHLSRQIDQRATGRYECLAYDLFETFLAALPAYPGTAQRQFLLLKEQTVSPSQRPDPLFVSPLFAIEARDRSDALHGFRYDQMGDGPKCHGISSRL